MTQNAKSGILNYAQTSNGKKPCCAQTYEASGIAYINSPNGKKRYLVIDNEEDHCLFLVKGTDTTLSTTCISLPCDSCSYTKLVDMEGIALGNNDYIYVITSHTRGRFQEEREQLVRFKLSNNNEITDLELAKNFRKFLLAAYESPLKAAAKLDKEENGLNIEGLAYDTKHDHLIIGFRSPILNGQTLLAVVTNPDKIFGVDRKDPKFDTMITLNLNGQGVRGMTYGYSLKSNKNKNKGFWIIAGPSGDEETDYHLWFWSGNRDKDPKRATIQGKSPKDLKDAEGITVTTVHGKKHLLIVKDNGNRQTGSASEYLFIDFANIKF